MGTGSPYSSFLTLGTDGGCVVYNAEPEDHEPVALYGSCRVDGAWEPAKLLSAGIDEEYRVETFSITRDGTRVLIHVRHETHADAAERLYLGPLDGSSPAIEVGPPGESVERKAHHLLSSG